MDQKELLGIMGGSFHLCEAIQLLKSLKGSFKYPLDVYYKIFVWCT